jgi:hypothetical protein
VTGDQHARDVARGRDPVIAIAGNTDREKLLSHRLTRAGSVGNQDHGPAAVAKQPAGFDSLRKRVQAVMHHAPDIRQPDVVAPRQAGDGLQNGN